MGELLSILVLQLHLLLLLLFAVSLSGAAAADDDHADSSFLPLYAGLHLRMPADFPISSHDMQLAVIPTLDAGGLFWPILSSPSFNHTSHNSSLRPAFGFSLGFYFSPISYTGTYIAAPCSEAGCNIYLALCAGSLGHVIAADGWVSLSGALSSTTATIYPFKTSDGFAAPVWIANLNSPIRYADKASLIVELVTDSKGSTSTLELQLRDGENDALWRVRDVGTMEVQGTGHLVIYDSPNRTHRVWQSSRTDTLIEGQSLTPGRELVSNDSSYVARMENGGLVLSMNNTHFNMPELQPTPYWLFPIFRDDFNKSLHFNINQFILTAPCSSSPAHTDLMGGGFLFPGFANVLLSIVLYPGSCSSRKSFLLVSDTVQRNISWTFMRLENDAKLYSYAVFNPGNGDVTSVMRTAVADSDNLAIGSIDVPFSEGFNYSIIFTPPFLEWQECNLPMACGPLGVCTPGAKTICTCVEPSFEAINMTDFSQGCKRRTNLPPCSFGNGHSTTDSIDFVELDSTASILLFNGWIFDSTHAQVDACKQSCSSDCSCNGFFYQMDTSLCFFITDEISLLTVPDKILSFVNYTSSYDEDPTVRHNIYAKNYVTHLKITTANNDVTPLKVSSEKRTSKKVLMIALSAIIPTLVLGSAIYFFRARQKKSAYNSMLAQEEKELKDILPLLPSRFSYKELYEATKGFSNLLGTGGCGSVYAGVLFDGRKIAVKVLQVLLQGTVQSKQFLAEVATVGHTGHHNIVRLVGFCWEVSQRLLVYEYVERGSLDRWIFVKKSMGLADETSTAAVPLLDWKTRYNVALGIARGLSYLHEECEQPILHFDIKPQNILLDDDFVAKLADFGMSRLMHRDMTSVVTGVRGTPGYIAPEWYSQGTVSKKSDVYSMGMVLLEIVGGRKNLEFSLLNSSTDPGEQEAWHFPSWAAKKCEQGLMMEVVDKRLHACGFDAEQAHRLIHIAFWCIHEDPGMRPNAPTVVQWLEGSSPVEQPPFFTVLNAGRRPNTKVAISLASQLLSSHGSFRIAVCMDSQQL